MTTARSRSRIRSPRASTTPPSVPSTPCSTTPAAPNTFRSDDAAALDAVVKLARTEGILPALESAHAVAEAIRIAPTHAGA